MRPAEERDAIAVAALQLQHERELGAERPTGFLDEVADAWLRGRERRRTWVAVQSDGRPVGVLHGEIVEQLPSPRPAARRWMHVSLVFVSVDRRGAGLGERLLREAVAWARRQGLSRVDLNAVPDARALYRRIGFVPAPERAMTLALTE